MICSKCNSKWESKIAADKCPFCGASLRAVNTDHMTIPEGISGIVAQYGIDTLTDSKRFLSLIMDFVRDCEKEKKLLRIACNCGILKEAVAIKESHDDERDILIKKAIKQVEEEAFLSSDNAEYIVSLILQGVGVPYSRTTKEKPVQATQANPTAAQQSAPRRKTAPEVEPAPPPQAGMPRSASTPAEFRGNEAAIWSIVNEKKRPTKDENAAILALGRKLLKLGKTTDGIKLIKYTSQYGYAHGNLLLGYCYDKGIGVAQDTKIATAYYQQAGIAGGADESFKFRGVYDVTHRSRACAVAERLYNEKP